MVSRNMVNISINLNKKTLAINANDELIFEYIVLSRRRFATHFAVISYYF